MIQSFLSVQSEISSLNYCSWNYNKSQLLRQTFNFSIHSCVLWQRTSRLFRLASLALGCSKKRERTRSNINDKNHPCLDMNSFVPNGEEAGNNRFTLECWITCNNTRDARYIHNKTCHFSLVQRILKRNANERSFAGSFIHFVPSWFLKDVKKIR